VARKRLIAKSRGEQTTLRGQLEGGRERIKGLPGIAKKAVKRVVDPFGTRELKHKRDILAGEIEGQERTRDIL
jgi:hypothetical protein